MRSQNVVALLVALDGGRHSVSAEPGKVGATLTCWACYSNGGGRMCGLSKHSCWIVLKEIYRGYMVIHV